MCHVGLMKFCNMDVEGGTKIVKSISGLVGKPICFERTEYFLVKMTLAYVHWQEM